MVSIICSTNRKDSNSRVFAQAISELLDEQNKENRLLDLRDLPDDYLFNNEVFGIVNTPLLQKQDEHVTEADAFVFVIPEYNGSFPGALKSFIDSFSPSRIHNKKALLVGISSGRAGNVRGLDHFTGVLNYLRVLVHPFKPAISHCHELVDSGRVVDEATLHLLKNALDDFTA
jgi:NAD(P)H-dependent FMN reductase